MPNPDDLSIFAGTLAVSVVPGYRSNIGELIVEIWCGRPHAWENLPPILLTAMPEPE